MAAVQERSQQRLAPGLSQTQTETQSRTGTQAILRLRGAHAPSRQSVRWAEDVVDNEGLGRKSSKVCCIYHRPKAVDESSDESSSDSSSDSSDSEADDGGRRRIPSGDHKGKGKGTKRDHDHDCGDHGHDDPRHGRQGGRSSKDKKTRRPSPNAYERVPKQPKPKDGAGEGSKGSGAKA
ncbi:protein phosphatase inhibitor [Colletotrichum graminicola]|uniref:Type 1 phosphatases regulator n=1 Tax=Colletotrichum graminicola (strain M1.001 / M2 / FGSC 10212) TaxID=645133 RepID=E3QGS2_COLGM|nr:protein phosphatase inhibitor [Colletotrichum graminicola M1.001]EFQ30060.1 protein phosphatase inhibitor [Colletotrichum graminicola M1.001]WDK09766.1 protein phosphatase inhibitor [Colletotrichum graminicola]